MRYITMADWEVTPYQKKLIAEVLESGRLTYGEKTRELERQFAKIHGAKYALFTNSGTSALKISLQALKERYGWQDGDEVIIPAVTFVATMNVVLMNNLVPVLVDVQQETANIDPEMIKAAITPKTRAIIPVHLLGQPADMEAVMEIAKEYNLEVVEDSCETMFVNQLRGTTACFSSYIAHLMVTGVGGLILTDDERLATEMRSIMFHGRDESYLNIDDNNKTGDAWKEMIEKRFYFPRRGYSDRATELEAALGLGDLQDWKSMIAKRQFNAGYIMDGLSSLDIEFPIVSVTHHAFMFMPMYVEDRDNLIVFLEKRGIHTRTMMPLISQPITEPYVIKNYPVAQYIGKKGLLLGCHQYLKKVDLDYLISSIKEFYNG